MLSLENIRHFIAVVEYSGINKAAERIFISPSSLSRSIQIAEREINKKLFDRVGRVIKLNEAGKEFYQKSQQLIAQYESLLIGNSSSKSELIGHFSIGASHFLSKHILAKKMNTLSKNHPRASFSVYSYDSSVLIKKIHMGEVDIGITFSLTPTELIESELLFNGQLFLCTKKKHPLAGKPFSEIKKTISNYPAIIHRPTDSIERCDNHPMFKEYNILPNIQLYWDSDFFALQALQDGNCWSMLPDIVIDSDSKVEKLNHSKNWNAPYEVRLFWNKKKPVQVLKEELLKNLN